MTRATSKYDTQRLQKQQLVLISISEFKRNPNFLMFSKDGFWWTTDITINFIPNVRSNQDYSQMSEVTLQDKIFHYASDR